MLSPNIGLTKGSGLFSAATAERHAATAASKPQRNLGMIQFAPDEVRADVPEGLERKNFAAASVRQRTWSFS